MLKSVDTYAAMTLQSLSRPLAVSAMCSEDLLRRYPTIADSVRLASDAIARVMVARGGERRIQSELFTWESSLTEAMLFPEVEEYGWGPTFVPSNGRLEKLDANVAACIPSGFDLCDGDKKIGILITERELVIDGSGRLYGGAAGSGVGASISHLVEAIEHHPRLLEEIYLSVCKKTGTDPQDARYLLEPETILRQGFARLLIHEMGHCVGLPLPEGSKLDTPEREKLYLKQHGIHCKTDDVEYGRVCIMNQADDLKDWFTQVFTEQLSQIEFCSHCQCRTIEETGSA